MNMNKKILMFISFFFTFFIINNNVYAACSDVYNDFPYPTAEQCERYSEGNFKCVGDGYSNTGIMSKINCVKGDECIDGFKLENGLCISESSNNGSLDENGTNNSNKEIPCSTYTTKETCGYIRKCKWRDNACQETFVAESPCNDDNIKIALRFVGYLLTIAKVAIPLIIIVMGTFDLFKSVVDKDEKSLSKQAKILLMRVVAGVFVFFIPTIIYALFEISSDLKIVSDEKYKACVDCLLKPTTCSTESNS